MQSDRLIKNRNLSIISHLNTLPSDNIAILWITTDGIIQKITEAEDDIVGYSRKEVLGFHIGKFLLTETNLDWLSEKKKKRFQKMSLLKHKNLSFTPVEITYQKTIFNKREYLLTLITKKNNHFGEGFTFYLFNVPAIKRVNAHALKQMFFLFTKTYGLSHCSLQLELQKTIYQTGTTVLLTPSVTPVSNSLKRLEVSKASVIDKADSSFLVWPLFQSSSWQIGYKDQTEQNILGFMVLKQNILTQSYEKKEYLLQFIISHFLSLLNKEFSQTEYDHKIKDLLKAKKHLNSLKSMI